MKKKLALDELHLQSFVTGDKNLGGQVGYAIDNIAHLSRGDNCHSPLCVSNPECSFKPCGV